MENINKSSNEQYKLNFDRKRTDEELDKSIEEKGGKNLDHEESARKHAKQIAKEREEDAEDRKKDHVRW